MKKMNILFTCSAPRWGGNEKWTSLAMAELIKRHNVYFCYKNESIAHKFGDMPKFKAPFDGYRDKETYKIISEIIEEKKIDVLVPTKRVDYVVCGLLAKKYKIKNVIRLGIARIPWIPVWHWWVYGYLNDGIIVNANKTKKILGFFPFIRKEKVRVIYNGINMPETVEDSGRETNSSFRNSNNTFVITSVGTIIKRKGYHHLLTCISMLPDTVKQKVKVQIIGEGHFLPSLKKLAVQLGLENNVEFLGFHNNPSRWVAQSDLSVLLSANEGISNAVLEAMIRGVPVWTTKAGGHAEFIRDGENGFLASSLKPQELSIQLEKIITSHNLKQIGLEGKKTVANQFNLNKMGENIENFIYEILDKD